MSMHTTRGSAAITVHHVGAEGEPVLVIDRATGEGAALVDYAATRTRFAPAASVNSLYPGVLAPAPTGYLDGMVRLLLGLIERHFGTGPLRPARARGNFSLVTMAPAVLDPLQRVPHVDTADRLQFATVHFLCGREHGGTGFFRHRATGFETIDAGRASLYRQTLDAELAHEDGRMHYPGDPNDPLFERIGTCDAAFDRLILYRAALLHSGLIAAVPALADDPRHGRLTGNLFLQCAPAA
jgi:hypothetical protein